MVRIAYYFYTSEIYIVRITFDVYISTSHSLIAISYRPSPLQFKSPISFAIHCFSKTLIPQHYYKYSFLNT